MLNIDPFFYQALKDDHVDEFVNGRIYNPARPEIDEEEDKIPYIIIQPMGETASMATKDKRFAPLDTATVDILCVAESREALADLTNQTDRAIRNAVNNLTEDSDIADITPSAGQVNFDPTKPCCYQTLSYQVECYTE